MKRIWPLLSCDSCLQLLNLMLRKERQDPQRSESLNLQKKKHTLELPRFYSKPKNTSGVKALEPLIKNHLFKIITAKPNRHVDQIPDLYKVGKDETQSAQKNSYQAIESPRKANSLKKASQSSERALCVIKYVSTTTSKKKLPTEKGTGEREQQSTIGRYNGEVYQPGDRRFRCKYLKSEGCTLMGKRRTGLTESKTDFQKEETSDTNQTRIQYKLPTEENPFRKSDTSANLLTQLTDKLREQEEFAATTEDLDMWHKITQLLRNLAKSTADLGLAEQYITCDRHAVEKKIYYKVSSLKLKNKIKTHLAVTRMSIYLYVHLIIHAFDIQMLLSIFSKLYQSHSAAANVFFSGNRREAEKRKERIYQKGDQDQWISLLSRNNQDVLRTMQIILSKRRIPQSEIFRNMLESSKKIQSFDFLSVIDKTLKWEILKMPSYPYLPPSHRDFHLVLDLDETLIHYEQKTETFHVRPYAEEFIVKASKIFEITVFTAATKDYADEIINEIDQSNNVSHRLYRNHLTFLDGAAIKDLSMLGRPLQKTIIVDNLSANFRLQPENGILIRSWYGEDDDEILLKLFLMLVQIVQKYGHDLRVGLKQKIAFIKEQIAFESLIYQLKCQL